MKWIGLTGGIASGKSTVAEVLRQNGIEVLDADQIAHELMRPGGPIYKQILQEFGPATIAPEKPDTPEEEPDKSLDRRYLGQLVFGHPERLKKLEALTHPEVRKVVQQRRAELAARGVSIAVYDVPLLFEKNLENQFDAIICVSTTVDLQRQRMRSRNHWSEDEISHRLAAQMTMAEKKRRADYVIENVGSLSDLRRQSLKVLRELVKGAADEN